MITSKKYLSDEDDEPKFSVRRPWLAGDDEPKFSVRRPWLVGDDEPKFSERRSWPVPFSLHPIILFNYFFLFFNMTYILFLVSYLALLQEAQNLLRQVDARVDPSEVEWDSIDHKVLILKDHVWTYRESYESVRIATSALFTYLSPKTRHPLAFNCNA